MSKMVDRLKLMPIKKWSEIKSLLKLDLPRSIAGFNFLDTMEEIEKLGLGYGTKVYCPQGDASNGIVALNVKDNLYELNIQCPKDDTRELEEALRTTTVIDWTQDIKLIYAQKHVTQCMIKAIKDKSISLKQIIPSMTFVKYKNDPRFDVSIPEGIRFEPLSLKHVETVNSKWFHKYPGSEKYIELLIKANFGYGFFKDDDLLAYLFKREVGDLAILFTDEKHRNKGYGSVITKLLCNICQQNGKHAYFSCVKTNTKAFSVFKNMGMTLSFEDEWCYFARKR